MTFNQFISTLRKRWAYVVVLVLLSCVVVGVGSKLSQPIYTARASAYFGLRTGATPGELYQGSNYTQQQISSYAILATKPIVLDSEISDLPPLTGFLRLSSLPIARVAIDRAHMERPDIAEPTVPLPVVSVRPITIPSPVPVPVPEPATDRTAGGAL